MPSALVPVSLKQAETDANGFAQALFASFQRYGFAVIADHGIDPELIEGCLARFKAFYALDDAAKRRYFVPGGAGQRGYTPFGIETAKGYTHHDLKEFWHVGRTLPADSALRDRMPDNLWVEEIPGFRDYAEGLFTAFDTMGATLLDAIARALGLPADYFRDKVDHGNSILRVLHYPPVLEGDTPHVRAGAHEDINVITLLLGAEEAGLELLDRDGRWLSISPPPGCLVVNIGDMLQRLTNHVLPSTTHRVVNPSPERARFPRYSMPFFLHFNPDYLIETLPGCITPDRPDRYPVPITADAYLHERLREIKLG